MNSCGLSTENNAVVLAANDEIALSLLLLIAGPCLTRSWQTSRSLPG